MSTIKFPNARVTTVTERFDKARATILEGPDGEGAIAVVLDRRSGGELLRAVGPLVKVDRTTYRVGDVLVERAQGCGCGGTTVTRL